YKKLLEINEDKFIDKWGAKPADIWENKSGVKSRELFYPIHKDKGVEYLNKALIDIKQNELNLAIFNLQNLINYLNSNKVNKIENISIEEIKSLKESIKAKLEINKNI
ncbi:MAG TPA: hypothetical protein PL041_05070, partial [Melioribacteraceae bacterium]|nr:hypothetical protein [Melioribacteraceae bacterium]